MHVETHGHQLEVTPALREHVDTKFQKLAKHFDQPLHVRVQLSVEKLLHKAEATAEAEIAAPLLSVQNGDYPAYRQSLPPRNCWTVLITCAARSGRCVCSQSRNSGATSCGRRSST